MFIVLYTYKHILPSESMNESMLFWIARSLLRDFWTLTQSSIYSELNLNRKDAIVRILDRLVLIPFPEGVLSVLSILSVLSLKSIRSMKLLSEFPINLWNRIWPHFLTVLYMWCRTRRAGAVYVWHGSLMLRQKEIDEREAKSNMNKVAIDIDSSRICT